MSKVLFTTLFGRAVLGEALTIGEGMGASLITTGSTCMAGLALAEALERDAKERPVGVNSGGK